MGQSAKDPIFYAALEKALNDNPEAGKFCFRCHMPVNWLQGRYKLSSPIDNDRDGITCDFCHRLVDPMSKENKKTISSYSDNGQYLLSDEPDVKIGPRDDEIAPHKTKASPYFSSSALCGTCHDGTNPLTDTPLYRTYSEWKNSWYASQGVRGTCQSCHMRPVAGFAAEPRLLTNNVPYRDDIAGHDFAGAANWVFDALPIIWKDLDAASLDAAKRRSLEMLREAAALEISLKPEGNRVMAKVRVYNLTGHKLPTGFAPGRRVWLEIRGFDGGGRSIFNSGLYDSRSSTLKHDNQIKIYEAVAGTGGKGFHILKNIGFAKDNRIPPRGYSGTKFRQAGAKPVGAKYLDQQYWDDTFFRMPGNIKSVKATLYYQTASKEYIEFLSKSGRWGLKLRTAWNQTGRGRPIEMVTVTANLK